MRTWTIVLVGAVLSTALTFTVIRHSAHPAAAGGAPVAKAADQQRPSSPEKAPDSKTADHEHGWGPFRLTDW